MTVFFLNLQITRSNIRPYIKWVVSLVIAYGHINLLQGFVWVNILTLLEPRGYGIVIVLHGVGIAEVLLDLCKGALDLHVLCSIAAAPMSGNSRLSNCLWLCSLQQIRGRINVYLVS